MGGRRRRGSWGSGAGWVCAVKEWFCGGVRRGCSAKMFSKSGEQRSWVRRRRAKRGEARTTVSKGGGLNNWRWRFARPHRQTSRQHSMSSDNHSSSPPLPLRAYRNGLAERTFAPRPGSECYVYPATCGPKGHGSSGAAAEAAPVLLYI